MRFKRIIRSKAIYKIINSRGKWFGLTWKKGNRKYIANGRFEKISESKRSKNKLFGRLTIWDRNTGKFRTLHNNEITGLNIDKEKYIVK